MQSLLLQDLELTLPIKFTSFIVFCLFLLLFISLLILTSLPFFGQCSRLIQFLREFWFSSSSSKIYYYLLSVRKWIHKYSKAVWRQIREQENFVALKNRNELSLRVLKILIDPPHCMSVNANEIPSHSISLLAVGRSKICISINTNQRKELFCHERTWQRRNSIKF